MNTQQNNTGQDEETLPWPSLSPHIHAAQGNGTPGAPIGPRRPPAPPSGRTRRWWLTGAIILLVLLFSLDGIFLVVLAQHSRNQGKPTPAPVTQGIPLPTAQTSATQGASAVPTTQVQPTSPPAQPTPSPTSSESTPIPTPGVILGP